MSVAPNPVHGVRDPRPNPQRDATSAWLSLLLYLPSLGAAFLVGEGLATWLFGWPDNTDPVFWEMLVATVPALLVFALPVVPAWHFGMRAHRHGAPSGRLAAWLAVAIAVAFVGQNALAYVLGQLFG
jgi:hypothetical protein